MRVTRRNNNLTDITGTRHIITGVKTDVNQAVVTGTARNAMGSFVLATLPLRKHDLDSPSNLGLVLLPSNVVNELDKLLVALLDDRFWNLILHDASRSVRTDGILERESRRESRLLDDSHRLGEIFVGFTRKTDNDISSNSSVRDGLAHPVEDAQELRGSIRTAHPTQHLVRTGLQRHVQAWHDVRSLSHSLDNVVGKSGRMWGSEPHPL